MDSHISQFVRSLEICGNFLNDIYIHSIDRDILWTIIQNQSNNEVTGVNKAAIQGQLLVEMLQGLFNNLNGVLSNFRFIIEVIGVKVNHS